MKKSNCISVIPLGDIIEPTDDLVWTDFTPPPLLPLRSLLDQVDLVIVKDFIAPWRGDSRLVFSERRVDLDLVHVLEDGHTIVLVITVSRVGYMAT